MEWTNEKIEELRKLWEEGLSASKIANILGEITRNAVIGKVHRLKLSGRGRNGASTSRIKKVETVSQTALNQETPSASKASFFVPDETSILQTQIEKKNTAFSPQETYSSDKTSAPLSRQLELVQLTERTCKWPEGDPLQKNFSFCGNDSVETGPYCSYHTKIAFQGTFERRKTRPS